jgi:hypothetical protein
MGTLAEEMGSSRGGVAVQLARARAKLRVDYLMALRRGPPPTSRCRSVLIALSAGDRRRQATLDVSNHLLDCEYCAALSEALQHRRGLTALLPLGIIGRARNYLAQQLQTAGGQVAAGGAAVATVGVIVLALSNSGAPTTKASSLSVRGEPVAPREIANLDRFAGLEVKASGSMVRSVPADEGFWIGGTGDNQVWVELTGKAESPVNVRVERRVSFLGRIVDHSRNFVRRVGIDQSESAPLLRRQQQHIVVKRKSLQIR